MVQRVKLFTSQPSCEVFFFAFKEWLFIFITILVPLDLLYRIGVLLNAFPPLQLIGCFSSTVIFFTIFVVIISLLSLIAAWLLTKVTGNGTELVNKANTLLGILFVAIIFSDYLWPWIEITFANSNVLFFIKKLKYLILVIFLIMLVISIIFLNKKDNHIIQQVRNIPDKFFKLNSIIVIFSIVFSLSVTMISYFANQKEYGSVALTDKNKLKSYPNIILITFDALSAQHTSLYGYHYNTTPNLDKLAHESYVFDNMYSSCNWTMPSLSSLLSGKHPWHHQLNNELSYFFGKNKNQNLPAVLKALGYETAVAWSGGFSCPLRINLGGVDKVSPNLSLYKVIYVFGFGANPWLFELIQMNRIYKIVFGYTKKFMKKPNELDAIIRPDLTFANASELLNSMQKPRFLWIHIYPPHGPYLPGDGFMYSILKERVFDTEETYSTLTFVNPYPIANQPKIDQFAMRYDEHISYVDHEFGKFLSFLNEKGLFKDSILIISSDHGEMFERGFWGHGGPYLYQSLTHVPLVIHLPGQVQGQRIGANVSHVDIAPTILDFLGTKPPAWMDGKTFMPALKNNNFDTGTKLTSNLSFINFHTNVKLKTKSIASIRGNYKLIKYLDWDQYELYDLKNDPGERINLIASKPAVFSSLKAEIDRTLAK